MEWNATEFKFIGTPGTLVKKKKEMGKRPDVSVKAKGEEKTPHKSPKMAAAKKTATKKKK